MSQVKEGGFHKWVEFCCWSSRFMPTDWHLTGSRHVNIPTTLKWYERVEIIAMWLRVEYTGKSFDWLLNYFSISRSSIHLNLGFGDVFYQLRQASAFLKMSPKSHGSMALPSHALQNESVSMSFSLHGESCQLHRRAGQRNYLGHEKCRPSKFSTILTGPLWLRIDKITSKK